MSENRKVPEMERAILDKINYANRILEIKLKYKDDGNLSALFKKAEILKIFEQLGYKPKYLQGGGYVISKHYEDYLFELNCINLKNVFDFRLSISKDGKYIENRVSGMRYILNFIPFDQELATESNSGKYGLSTLDDLKNYLNDMINLIFEFVDEYIKEINAGNVPE